MAPSENPQPATANAPPRWGWLPQILLIGSRRIRARMRILGLSILVGIVAGLGAIVFYVSTRVVEHYALGEMASYRPAVLPAGETPFAWLPIRERTFSPTMLMVVIVAGGLISGVLIYSIAPEAEGHGTDAVIEAYHQHGGYMRPRVPAVKIIASAITLGTGGSGGREGPIGRIGAGFGSALATMFGMRAADRRILLAAGMGSGIAAVFRAPLAGALFAAEVLYRSPEFESEVIVPAGIASVVSYSVYGLAFGWQPLFSTPDLTFSDPRHLGGYTILALFMVVLAMLYTRTFYGVTGAFRRLSGPRHIRPAIGAFITGLIGLGLYYFFGNDVLAVLSLGYGSIQQAISDETHITAPLLLFIALGKIATTSFTIGSGGSGGVFGPSVIIGGCGGGALGKWLHDLWPSLVPHPAAFVIVGMAGFFAAAAKTPFSSLVIVSEMTGGYHLLLPALWVCLLAFMLSDEQSIYSSQVASRSRSPAHQGSFVREALSGEQVSHFLAPGLQVASLRPEDSLATVIDRLSDEPYPVLPVVDSDSRLLGIVDLEEVQVASRTPELRAIVVAADVMRSDIVPLLPEDQLDRALELFVENDVLALPIVNDLEDRKVIGMVRRFEIASAYLRHVQGRSQATGDPRDKPKA